MPSLANLLNLGPKGFKYRLEAAISENLHLSVSVDFDEDVDIDYHQTNEIKEFSFSVSMGPIKMMFFKLVRQQQSASQLLKSVFGTSRYKM